MSFMTTLRSTLSASFRIGQNIEPELRDRLRKDVEQFVGTEIEIEIDEDGNAVSKPKRKAVADEDEDKGDDDDDDGDEEDQADDDANANANANDNDDDNANTNTETKTTTLIKLAPAKKVPYIPDAYQLSVDRRTIRRNPALQEFHEWLKVQTEAGFISRQETVSMIPPVVLSPESHHAVLDMCAGKFIIVWSALFVCLFVCLFVRAHDCYLFYIDTYIHTYIHTC